MPQNQHLLPFLISSWTIAALLTVLLGGLWYLSIHLRHVSRAKQQSDGHRRLPPGPWGLPVLGNLLMLGDLPHRNLHQMAQKYGPIMYIKLGLVPTVVVSSAQAAELFLKTHDSVFASRPYSIGSEYMSYGNKGMAFSQYGTYWRNMRKLCIKELLSAAKVESFKQMRREETGLFVGSLREAAKAGAVVDMSAKVGSLIEDMIFRMLIGHKVDNSLKPVVEEFFKLLGAFNLADFIPYIGTLDLQGLGRRMKEVSKVFDGFLEKIIDDRISKPKDFDDNQKDFIDAMLPLMVESNPMQAKEHHYMIHRTNIKAIILDMIVAATDTSFVTVEWVLSELLRHPKVMEKLQEELRNKVGIDRQVEEDDLVKLEYLDMVVKEAMRLHPVAPFLLPHESLEDITINGYHIPKKSRVIINAWAIQRDPNVWSTYDDVEKFLPERFIGTNIDIRGHDFQLIPFGSGRRGCPGMYLGLTVVKLILGQLVHGFNWELPNGMLPADLDMTEKFGIVAARANHLLAVPILCV